MEKYVALRNGVQMPRIGFGTWKLRGADCQAAVTTALSVGYELLDSASVYGNESCIGEILKAFPGYPKPRLETANKKGVFITSKAGPSEMGTEKTRTAALRTLKNFQQDSIDLYLLHWPGVSEVRASCLLIMSSQLSPTSSRNRELRLEAWKALEKLYKEGRVRAIGVSNFLPQHLRELIQDGAEVEPHVNQVEIHPSCPNIELRQYARRHGIVVQAYSSLGHGTLSSDTLVVDVAKKEKISASQVLLRWALQNDLCVIPKSRNKKHMEENLAVLSTLLTQESMSRLDSAAASENHTCWDPRTIS